MGVLKSVFGPGMGWFTKLRVIVDLGFVGMDKIYDIKELLIGHKRKRRKKGGPREELTKEQKEHNRMVSRERIYVEHAIGGMKRFRVLVNRSRIKCYNRKNRELGICAELHNYKISA